MTTNLRTGASSMEPKIRLYRPGDEAAVAQLAVAGFEQSIRQYYS